MVSQSLIREHKYGVLEQTDITDIITRLALWNRLPGTLRSQSNPKPLGRLSQESISYFQNDRKTHILHQETE
jgi:hypothetical protein